MNGPISVVARSRTGNKGERPKCARCLSNEWVYLQLSLRVALPDSGVPQLQLGSEAQMTLSPFFLIYLYSMAVLAGSVTIAFHPGIVRKLDKSQFDYSPDHVG